MLFKQNKLFNTLEGAEMIRKWDVIQVILLIAITCCFGVACFGIEYASKKAPTVKKIEYQERVFFVNITSVYDGDTFTGDIDLGFGVVMKDQTFRLFDVNTPELRGDERAAGLVEKKVLEDQIKDKQIVIRAVKVGRRREGKGKYGRWIAEIKGVVK